MKCHGCDKGLGDPGQFVGYCWAKHSYFCSDCWARHLEDCGPSRHGKRWGAE